MAPARSEERRICFASATPTPREEARLIPPADIDAWVEADLLALSRKVREHGAERLRAYLAASGLVPAP